MGGGAASHVSAAVPDRGGCASRVGAISSGTDKMTQNSFNQMTENRGNHRRWQQVEQHHVSGTKMMIRDINESYAEPPSLVISQDRIHDEKEKIMGSMNIRRSLLSSTDVDDSIENKFSCESRKQGIVDGKSASVETCSAPRSLPLQVSGPSPTTGLEFNDSTKKVLL